jgi:hypothetical protein
MITTAGMATPLQSWDSCPNQTQNKFTCELFSINSATRFGGPISIGFELPKLYLGETMDYKNLIQELLTAYLIVLLVGVVLYFVFAHLVAKAARRKGRSYGSFYWISLAVGPMIPAIIVATLPFDLDDPKHPRNRAAASQTASADYVSNEAPSI